MNNKIKIFTLLGNLDNEEFSRFGDYIRCPLFNKRHAVTALFEEIEKYYPDFSDSSLSKEKLFGRLYKGEVYNDERMRNLLSRLNALLNGFLSLLNFMEDDFSNSYGLLSELKKRGYDQDFKTQLSKTFKHYEERLPVDTETFLRGNRLAAIESAHYFETQHTSDTDSKILKNREIKLTRYFIADILNIYSLMANQVQLYPERKYDFTLLETITSYMQKNSQDENFYHQVYYYILMLSLKQTDEFYYKLKKTLNKNAEKLSVQERGKTYTALHNYLQEQIFKSKKSERDKLELYKESFANGGEYLSNNKIRNTSLILAVSCCLTLKEFGSASDFVTKYISEIEEYYKQSTEFYCSALIDYYKKDYSSALKKLNCVRLEDFSYKILVRTLTLMIYFSMDHTESFFSLTDSFSHFLRESFKTKHSSKYFTNIYMNFIGYTIKLFKIKEKGDIISLSLYRKELVNAEHVAKKQWLLEMADEIEKKVK